MTKQTGGHTINYIYKNKFNSFNKWTHFGFQKSPIKILYQIQKAFIQALKMLLGNRFLTISQENSWQTPLQSRPLDYLLRRYDLCWSEYFYKKMWSSCPLIIIGFPLFTAQSPSRRKHTGFLIYRLVIIIALCQLLLPAWAFLDFFPSCLIPPHRSLQKWGTQSPA